MALPDGCEIRGSHLVFCELATEPQLVDVEKLYEFCCTVACTNGLRPMGPVEVVRWDLPALAADESVIWGNRSLTAEAAFQYAEQGFLLCELRLPVQGMSAAVPPGISQERPASTV
ncbi:MAG: hypothetical protein ACHQDE_03380 [Acidimicrobiia bacterium]